MYHHPKRRLNEQYSQRRNISSIIFFLQRLKELFRASSMIFYTTLILAVAAASRTSEVRAAAEEPSVSSSFLMSEFEAAVMTDDDDQQRELFKTTKSVKKNSKDSHHYFQSLCNIHLFEGKFEYQNGCEQTTVATVVGGSKDTGYYTETLLDGVSSCSLIHRRTEESDSKEEEEDDQCSVGKPNRFIGGAFNAKAAIAYNKRTGDCELMYTDLPTDPCDVYPQSLGVKAVINVRNKHAIIPSIVTTTTTETNFEVPQVESRDMMFLYFTNDLGDSFYNGRSPRIARRASAMEEEEDHDEGDERFNNQYYQMIVDRIKKDAEIDENDENDDGRRSRSLHGDGTNCIGCSEGEGKEWWRHGTGICYHPYMSHPHKVFQGTSTTTKNGIKTRNNNPFQTCYRYNRSIWAGDYCWTQSSYSSSTKLNYECVPESNQYPGLKGTTVGWEASDPRTVNYDWNDTLDIRPCGHPCTKMISNAPNAHRTKSQKDVTRCNTKAYDYCTRLSSSETDSPSGQALRLDRCFKRLKYGLSKTGSGDALCFLDIICDLDYCYGL